MSLLGRTVLADLARLLLLTLAATTAVMCIGTVLKLQSDGLELRQIAALLPLAVPGLLPYTVPVALLAAVTLCYGRMSADNEIAILGWGGVAPSHAALPALLLAVGTVGLLLPLTFTWAPLAKSRLDWESRRAAVELPFLQLAIGRKNLRLDRETVRDDGTRIREVYEIHVAGDVGRDGTLHDVRIFREEDRRAVAVMTARTGRLSVDRETWTVSLELADLTIVPIDREGGRLGPPSHSERSRIELVLPQPDPGRLDPDRMTFAEGRSRLDDDDLDRKKKRELRTDLAGRIAVVLTPLGLVLLGIPLGQLFRASSGLYGFGVSLLPVFGIYYPLLTAGEALALRDALPHGVAMGMAPAGIALVGGLLYYTRVCRR